MDYLNWNEALGRHFFNPQKTGEAIYLHADRKTIEDVGIGSGYFDTPDAAWMSFLKAVKLGFSQTKPFDFLEKSREAFQQKEKWKKERRIPCINKKSVEYPPHLTYLVLSVLPLTEGSPLDLKNKEAYYPRLEDFLNRHFRHPKMKHQTEQNNWNTLWQALSDWSIIEKNGDWGVFKNPEYRNAHWKYVGKPITQCLVPLQTRRHLPQLFADLQLAPQQELNRKDLRERISRRKADNLLTADLQRIIVDENNEMGNAALDQISGEYQRWTGETTSETDLFSTTKTTDKAPRGPAYTKARLFVLIKLLDIQQQVQFEYRLQTPLDYPEDLTFNGRKCYDSTGGWSNPLNIDNQLVESLNLRDDAHFWEAILPKTDVRFFLKADRYNIGGNRWAEVNPSELYLGATALALVKKSAHLPTDDWRGSCDQFNELNYRNLPNDWQLFSLGKIKGNLTGISQRQMGAKLDNLSIILRGGLSVGYRRFLDLVLPEVFVENARGSETVFLKTKDGAMLQLCQKEGFGNVWLLPDNTPRDAPFCLVVKDVKCLTFDAVNGVERSVLDVVNGVERSAVDAINGVERSRVDAVKEIESWAFEILNHQNLPQNPPTIEPPRRDNWGDIACNALKNNGLDNGLDNLQNCQNTEGSVVGIQSSSYDKRISQVHGSYFFSNNPANSYPKNAAFDQTTNALLYFLTQQKEVNKKTFFDAFETLLNASEHAATERQDNADNITWLKRRALSLYESLGFVDIEVSKKDDKKGDKIRVLPPQLIPIPSPTGMTFSLVGARTPDLITTFLDAAQKRGFAVQISPQSQNLTAYLLPPRIALYAREAAQISEIRDLAEACQLFFDYDRSLYPSIKFPQIGLLSTTGNLDNWLKNLKPAPYFSPEGLICQLFNAERCRFETAVDSSDFDKTFQLAIYKINEYSFRTILWRDGAAFEADRQWARLAALQRIDKPILYFQKDDNTEGSLKKQTEQATLYVPTSMDLPRYFRQALTLCSGFAPDVQRLDIEGWAQQTKWYVFRNVPKLIIEEQCQKLGQKLQETDFKHI